jgi:RNA polymerase sigma factor (sigma-70 family)
MTSLKTRATLLARIRDPNDKASWDEFVTLYMPLVYSYALKRGFQDADAADLAQETMVNVVRTLPTFRYDADRGTFRGWLLTILLNLIRKRWNLSTRECQGTGDTRVLDLLQAQPEREDIDLWEHEYQLRAFHWAANRVKSQFREPTWLAFWNTTVEGKSIAATAQQLGLSEGAIYIARSRVLAKIRAEILQAEQWELSHETHD